MGLVWFHMGLVFVFIWDLIFLRTYLRSCLLHHMGLVCIYLGPLLGLCLYLSRTWIRTCLFLCGTWDLSVLPFQGCLFSFGIWLRTCSSFTWDLHLNCLGGSDLSYWLEDQNWRCTSYVYNTGLFQSFAQHIQKQDAVANSNAGMCLLLASGLTAVEFCWVQVIGLKVLKGVTFFLIVLF